MCAADAKGQNEPAGHSVQELVVAPSVLENVPASQFVGAVIPAVGQRVPGGHIRQSRFDVAPLAPLNVPALHCVEFIAPRDEKLPAVLRLQFVF